MTDKLIGETYMVALGKILDQREGCQGCRKRECVCWSIPDDTGDKR